MIEKLKKTRPIRLLALMSICCLMSPLALAVAPTKREPPSLKALAQSRLGAFTKQGVLAGVIEPYIDPYGTSGFYLLLLAGTNYIGVPVVDARDNQNSYYISQPYTPNFWVTPNYLYGEFFESYDCAGTPIIDARGDGAVRLGVLPAIGYIDAVGQTRIAFSTSFTTQVFTSNSWKSPAYGCTTQTQQISGYRFSGSISFESQLFGRRLPL